MPAERRAAVAPPPQLGSPQEFILPRDGDRDLKFTGWRIAHATGVSGFYQTTIVDIYVTQGGKFITSVTGYRLGFLLPEAAKEIYQGETRKIDGRTWCMVASLSKFQEAEARGVRLEHLDERNTVAVHSDGEDVVSWLKKDNRGALGSLGKIAWIEACTSWPSLTDLLYETVQ